MQEARGWRRETSLSRPLLVSRRSSLVSPLLEAIQRRTSDRGETVAQDSGAPSQTDLVTGRPFRRVIYHAVDDTPSARCSPLIVGNLFAGPQRR